MERRQMVYVWEFPVRFFHWQNALCITTLFCTGLYIGHPVLSPSGEATNVFVLGWVRYIHFVTAYIFLALWIFRIYWFFAGNRYAKNIFRFWSPGAWRSVGHHLKGIATAAPEMDGEMPGSDQLARMAHGLFFTASMLMIVTGFAMYGEANPTGWAYGLTRWVYRLAGSGRPLVLIHHYATWFFPIFVLAHLYQVFRTDNLTRQGLVSSMFTGYYHVPEKVLKSGSKAGKGLAGD
ncbi:MAG TPA: Ni/Fe-hydrogenase, b-type cytochrome subunit [Symbiobacteriaceae bacterium]|nr:Ni/Fe-hydrogenase, b-type cytochrome subunit [Symbiobacteriaceae bacterium]